jgi:hypothetical protein
MNKLPPSSGSKDKTGVLKRLLEGTGSFEKLVDHKVIYPKRLRALQPKYV